MFDTVLGGLIGATVVLFGIYIAQRTGYLQVSLMSKAHDLNLVKASPKIDADIRVELQLVNGPNYPPAIFLHTTIHNEGELAAKQLNGYWKLSSTQDIKPHTIPIRRDFLGSTPYEFEPHGLRTRGSVWVSPSKTYDVSFEVDIEFDYLALPDDKPEHYSAKYSYHAESGQMIRN